MLVLGCLLFSLLLLLRQLKMGLSDLLCDRLSSCWNLSLKKGFLVNFFQHYLLGSRKEKRRRKIGESAANGAFSSNSRNNNRSVGGSVHTFKLSSIVAKQSKCARHTDNTSLLT